jgi:hypothetical protein
MNDPWLIPAIIIGALVGTALGNLHFLWDLKRRARNENQFNWDIWKSIWEEMHK